MVFQNYLLYLNWHLSTSPAAHESPAFFRHPNPAVKIEVRMLRADGSQTPPATLRNCSADISSDDSAAECKYSSAVKGVPALSDNLASFSAVDLTASI